MTRRGKTKICRDCKPPKTPADKVRDLLQTHSSVCFQSLPSLCKHPIRGVFQGLTHKPPRNTLGFDTGWFLE